MFHISINKAFICAFGFLQGSSLRWFVPSTYLPSFANLSVCLLLWI